MKPILIVVIVALLALDWAALDDITTGSEPSSLSEWLIVIISVPLLLTAGYFLLRRRK